MSLTVEDLQAILRCNHDDSSGSKDELVLRIVKGYGGLPWKILLNCVPKDSLQRLCGERGLRSDRMKDELIDQIANLRTKAPRKDGPLRSWGDKWMR